MSVFKTASGAAPFNIAAAMSMVAARYGKSGWRQAIDVARHAFGPRRMDPKTYYLAALFRPELTFDEKRAHVSYVSSDRVNIALTPKNTSLRLLIDNKLLTGNVLQAAGFPVLKALAYYSARGGAPGVRSLDAAAMIADFLASEGALPCFGKPVDGSLSIGGASYMAQNEDGASVRLGDGRTFTRHEIAAQIVQHFPRGYLFQPLIRQIPEIEALCGPAVGTFRVVTLWGSGAPEVLYTLQKLPAKGAMMDASDSTRSNGFACVDPDSGVVTRAQLANRMNTEPLLLAPATGAELLGVVVPNVAEAVEMCRQAHRLFPTHGILGFDIANTTDGLIINEINANPAHFLYQRSADRGLLNPDFAPRIAAVSAFMAKSNGRK